MCVCVRVCVCACVRACVRACVCVCVCMYLINLNSCNYKLLFIVNLRINQTFVRIALETRVRFNEAVFIYIQ